MTPEFDRFCEGLWDNINKAKKKGKVSSKWKNDPKYRKQMKTNTKTARVLIKSIQNSIFQYILKKKTRNYYGKSNF